MIRNVLAGLFVYKELDLYVISMLVCLHTYYKEVRRMLKDKKAFGNLLRELIRQSGLSQAEFYSAIEITKPYFYDILSGKVNPPPSKVQYKMLEHLNVDEPQRNEFFNLAAKGRQEIPADIAKLISDHPEELDKIRKVLKKTFDTKG